MRKLALISALIFILALNGCNSPKASPAAANNNDIPVEDRTKKLSDSKTVGDSQENNSKTLGQAKGQGIEVNKKPYKGEKLNFEVLGKLNNTKRAWGLSLNKEHKTPGIPSDIRNLIAKYDGIYVGDTSKKVVYLTFDEGYENGYTSKILDTLKENDVKSIFFITGAYLKAQPQLVARMLAEGHQIGNHTINHPSLPGASDASLENELLGLQKQVESQFGMQFKYMRPPMGEFSEKTLAAVQQLGMKTVFWSFAYDDYNVNNQRGADYAYNKVMDNLHDGAVYLLHAVSKDNTEALDRIIKDLKAKGYEIRGLDL